MQPDRKANIAGAPVVSLGGSEWFIPELAIRQNRVVIPKIMELFKAFTGDDGSVSIDHTKITTEQFDALIDVAYTALTRAYPSLSKDDFLDLPMTALDLVAAMTVICKQAGLIAKEEPAIAGEDKGETASSPIGMDSSPSSSLSPDGSGT